MADGVEKEFEYYLGLWATTARGRASAASHPVELKVHKNGPDDGSFSLRDRTLKNRSAEAAAAVSAASGLLL